MTCLMIVVFMAASTMFVQSWGIINPDVSFLAWTAREVLGPAMFGVDIYEVNPPLAFMIYTPAALLSQFMAFDLAIKLWVTALGCLSVIMFWQSCDARLRLPLTITLALFIAFALPEGFGQREQIAFMLTAPYVAGTCRGRAGSVLVGVMAGVGFAIKPYFLIPLALVFATRRKIGVAEWAIVATGALYAAVLLLFFRPYLFEFVPLARATYWAIHLNAEDTWYLAGFILLVLVPFSLAGAPQPAARGFAAAAFGFTAAALIQFKGFGYHFNPALGYLLLFLTARACNANRLLKVCAGVMLLALAYFLGSFTVGYGSQNKSLEAMNTIVPELQNSSSFHSFSLSVFPSFPTALYTKSEYRGMSAWAIFIKAAQNPLSSPELRQRARQVSLNQAVRELERQPELILVETQDLSDGWARTEFDLLSFLQTDQRFRELWRQYRYDKSLAGYDVYRRP